MDFITPDPDIVPDEFAIEANLRVLRETLTSRGIRLPMGSRTVPSVAFRNGSMSGSGIYGEYDTTSLEAAVGIAADKAVFRPAKVDSGVVLSVEPSGQHDVGVSPSRISLHGTDPSDGNETLTRWDFTHGDDFKQTTYSRVGGSLKNFLWTKDDGTETDLMELTTAGLLTVLGNEVWHEGNDGTGSGLDADLLDGMDSTAFAAAAHTHPIADLTDFTVSGVATGDYFRKSAGDWVNVTISQVLTDLKTVDGSGSGLDADLVRATTPGTLGLAILDDATASAGRDTLGASSGIWGLAIGGTAADLSATGGSSQVLRQSSAGAAVTVSQLAAADISDFSEAVDDRVDALIQDGTGISWAYSDAGNTLTPTVSLSAFDTADLAEGTNLYYTDERVDDRVSSLLVEGTGIVITYDDTANTLTVETDLDSTYQPLDATLTALAGLTIAANSITIGTGADAFSQTTFAANTFPARASTGDLVAKSITDFGLSLIDDAAASNARTTLGLVIGTDVQAQDGTLAALAALTIAANSLTIGTGADAFSQTTFAASTFPARASAGSLEAKTITDFGLSLIDDASNGDARTTLGLGTVATESTVPIAKGGTGQTTQTAAFDALSPLTTAGDIIYHNGTDNIRLGIGSANQVLTVNSGATAPEWAAAAASDLVYTATPSDTAVNSLTDVQILTTNVTDLAAGDQLLVSGSFTILNNSGSARIYNVTLDFDGLFDIELVTASLSASATSEHPLFFEGTLSVRSSGLAYMTCEMRGYTATASAAGADNASSTGTFSTSSWNTSASDATGTVAVSLNVHSASATATQTFRLHTLTIRKVSP